MNLDFEISVVDCIYGFVTVSLDEAFIFIMLYN